jgi:putative membrane-bound dehydrogenase-like protein
MRALLFLLLSASVLAAESPLPGQRPRVLVAEGEPLRDLPTHTLPAGFTLSRAAAAPLVTHPTMGCMDDKGRLFLCDCIGVNWKKEQLDAEPVNRVLMLEDVDADGVYERSTIYADQLSFPQGALWLQGSLYVCSPPAVWRLTDADGDGVAEQRQKIAGDFDYTGNAADIHGPFLHPSTGRIYWCHGRKGHRAVGDEGKVVHEGMACGIWSCNPDGSGLDWHALGCGDNPVEIDFTPEGDILGVQNLYGSNPRADTLIHWLHKGVYERADQMQVIAELPQLLSPMPVVHNFGHVAVSGICFWHRSPLVKVGHLDLMVTHFNTQRLVRMELRAEAGSYRAVETEFLRMERAPDVHFTDVLEDPRDGSLLVIDTGGWFRSGCPSSLMEKPDLLGAVYRIRSQIPAEKQPCWQQQSRSIANQQQALAALKGEVEQQRRACEWLAVQPAGQLGDAVAAELKKLLSRELPPALNFCVLRAAIATWPKSAPDIKASPAAMVNLARLVANTPGCGLDLPVLKMQAAEQLNSDDPAWAAAADAALRVGPAFGLGWHHLAAAVKAKRSVEKIARWVPHAEAEAKPYPHVLTELLRDARPAVQQLGLRLLSA